MLIESDIGWEIFFNYGEQEDHLDLEVKNDLQEILLQDKRSMFYFRNGSAGINEYENDPNGIDLQIMARFEIASAVAYRNTVVSNGAENTRDRRIAVSQNSIGFEAKDGELNVNILYIMFAKYETPKSNSFPLVR